MEYMRQLDLLDPTEIKSKTITLVGAGATGSYVALALAQLGWGDHHSGQGKLIIFDGDKVKDHNLCNQVYERSHVGKSKVESLKEIIFRKCGFTIEVHDEYVDEKTDPSLVRSNYVLLLTDTMKSRKEIFEKFLEFSLRTDLVIETRMGIKDGRVYAFNPNDVDHKREWKSTLYSDKEAEASGCGASASIITTVMFLAALAAQRVVQHFNLKYGFNNLKGESKISKPLWNEAQFSLYPEDYYLREFGEEPVLTQKLNATVA
jgi:predicted ThiF/HesA family dinucleotide-utilizing enzyme